MNLNSLVTALYPDKVNKTIFLSKEQVDQLLKKEVFPSSLIKGYLDSFFTATKLEWNLNNISKALSKSSLNINLILK